MKLILDLETNNRLQECTKIHCCSIRELTTNEEFLITNQADLKIKLEHYIQDDIEFIGHNIFTYDNEVLKKLLGIDLTKTNKVIDTMIMSQVLCADLKDQDFKKFKGKVPAKLIGSHSLATWGYRLGVHKGDYQGGFEEYNDEMGVYCSQDTKVTRQLYLYLESLIGERTWR